MKPKAIFLAALCMAFLLVFAFSCSKGTTEAETGETATQEHGEAGEHTHEGDAAADHTHEGEKAGEHTRESGEAAEHTHGEEGEEAGPRTGLDETLDEIRNGIRLILSFDSELSTFVGTVENVTEKAVPNVRVEVHLSNGKELGPTEPVDLAPGKRIEVRLSAAGQTFTWWKAHAEAGLTPKPL